MKKLLSLALLLPLAAAASPQNDLLKDPVRGLSRAKDPVEAAEFLLSAGETGAVSAYAASLSESRSDLANVLASRVEFHRGNLAGALQSLEMLEKTDASSAAMKKRIQELLALSAARNEMKSDHFAISVPKEESFLVPSLLSALERSYESVEELYGVSLSTPVRVEVYSDPELFSRFSGLPEAALEKGLTTAAGSSRIFVLSPRRIPGGYRWVDAACGSLHRLAVDRLSGGLAPQWIREGLALRGGDEWRREGPYVPSAADANRFAEAALVNPSTGSLLIPFEKMEPSMDHFRRQDEVLLSQVQSADAVEFLLRENKAEKLRALLKAFRLAPPSQAFASVLGMNEAAFEKAWLKSLEGRAWVLAKGVCDRAVSFKKEGPPQDKEVQPILKAGDAARAKGQWAQALLQYRKGLALQPDNGVLLTRAAEALLETGDAEAAEASLRRAVEKNEFYAPAFSALGRLLYDDGRNDQAQRFLQEGLEIQPFDPLLHYYLGMISIDVGDTNSARNSFKISLELDPTNTDLRKILNEMSKRRR